MRSLLLFAASIFLITACSSPEKLYKAGKYDKSFNKSIALIEKKPENLYKHEKTLFASFDMLNNLNKSSIDNLLAQKNSYNKALALTKEIGQRQNKLIKKVYPSMLIDPSLRSSWVDVEDLSKAIRSEAYNKYHNIYLDKYDSLEFDKRKYSKELLTSITFQESFKSDAHDYANMALDVLTKGTERINVVIDEYEYLDLILDDLFMNNVSLYNSQFLLNAPLDVDVDKQLIISIKEVDPGYENFYTATTNHSRTVIDGYRCVQVEVEVPQPAIREIRTEQCGDSTVTREVWVEQPPKKVIETRQEPIYVTVCATETRNTIEKNAYVIYEYMYEDLKNNKTIEKKTEKVWYTYDDSNTSVSGDLRAIDHVPFCGSSYLNAPSDEEMIRRVRNSVKHSVYNTMKRLNK